MLRWIIPLVVVALVAVAFAVVYVAGTGFGVDTPRAGEPQAAAVSPERVAERAERVLDAAESIGVVRPKQILFGDLHVHTTFSFDAFQMSLPMAGGDGAYPVADACDFARHCAALDFWSINDHAITLSPRRWSETVESIRQCNAVASEGEPDLVSFLGWEWTQVGTTPANHWGHKNVILRDLDDDEIPSRPISAGIPGGIPEGAVAPGPFLLGALALGMSDSGGPAFAEYMTETGAILDCPSGVAVRDLPTDCREVASTPAVLFDKLDEWGHASVVIPHGTTWGFYTPLGSSWDKQLTTEQHDPARQTLVEVFSGHGNSEEYRSYQEIVLTDDGASCPEPTGDYLPSCWRAGEIISERCLAEGDSPDECEARAVEARQHYVEAFFNGGVRTVPGSTVADWQDSGQCRDCFQPAFNYRPKSSVQYMVALGREDTDGDPLRFQFGFIASSDNHSARPGTGYKEVSRAEFTEARFGNFVDTPLGEVPDEEPDAGSVPRSEVDPGASTFSFFETERQSSFFLNGGLAAVHSNGRDRDAVWQAMERKEVYGTSGPRILLWFDLLNPPGGRSVAMGSSVELATGPIFQARAVGSFEQQPGCPKDATAALTAEQLARLCQGECYHPSDQRRSITRIEVVRIRPQVGEDEEIRGRVEDPWKVFPCDGDPAGCVATFTDDEYESVGRDALYYVRAIEAPSPAVQADPLRCSMDPETGRCTELSPCSDRPWADDCLAETEERAWSSPIYVGQPRS